MSSKIVTRSVLQASPNDYSNYLPILPVCTVLNSISMVGTQLVSGIVLTSKMNTYVK